AIARIDPAPRATRTRSVSSAFTWPTSPESVPNQSACVAASHASAVAFVKTSIRVATPEGSTRTTCGAVTTYTDAPSLAICCAVIVGSRPVRTTRGSPQHGCKIEHDTSSTDDSVASSKSAYTFDASAKSPYDAPPPIPEIH